MRARQHRFLSLRYIVALGVVWMLSTSVALASLLMPPLAATAATLTDCRFGKAQIFDVQWDISEGFLNISGVTFPYGSSRHPNQLSDATLLDTDYFRFVPSPTATGRLTLEQFAADGTSKGILNDYVTPTALGDGFLFVQGNDAWGTVLTTGAGLEYGSSLSLAVTNDSPTDADLAAYTSCISTPLGAGQSVDDVTPDPVAPTITSATPPGGRVGAAYTHTITANGDTPVTLSVTGDLPPGLTFNPETGVISGTPTTAGSYPITVTATNAAGSDDEPYTLVVTPAPVAVEITSGAPNDAGVGASFTHTMTATGDATISFALASGTLPPGLTLDTATGVISGVPTAAGSTTFTVRATNGVTSDEQAVTIIVHEAVRFVTPSPVPDARAGMPFSFTPQVTGGASKTFRLTAGALPPGMSLDPATGAISGTPRLDGTYPITLEVTDGVTSATRVMTITVDPTVLGLAYTGVTSGPGVLIGAGVMQLLSGLGLVGIAIAYRRRLLAPNRALIRWMMLHPMPRW